MVLFRWVFPLLLVASGLCFALYAATGRIRYRKAGLVILKWTLVAAFGFFAVLIVERLV